jgi:hypothetical protein
MGIASSVAVFAYGLQDGNWRMRPDLKPSTVGKQEMCSACDWYASDQRRQRLGCVGDDVANTYWGETIDQRSNVEHLWLGRLLKVRGRHQEPAIIIMASCT